MVRVAGLTRGPARRTAIELEDPLLLVEGVAQAPPRL
jgi:hypothetical protein